MISKHLFRIFLLTMFPVVILAQKPDYNTLVKNYIKRFSGVAAKEMMLYRIPASITLAQGIIESNAGQSRLAVDANNHFGIKCQKDWSGKTYYQDDDAPNECFRKYDTPWESFRDHSYFLTQRSRYKALFDLDVTDYREWAKGLKAAGYATNPQYADLLIKTIENYELYRFDNASFQGTFGDTLSGRNDLDKLAWISNFEVVGEGPNHRKIYSNNGLKLTITRPGDYIEAISADFGIPVKQLVKYNDFPRQPVVSQGEIIYLESKRRKAASDVHLVKKGETAYRISQIYGIKLKVLERKNKLVEGVNPAQGSLLILR
ncbi:MAG: glucosaminidase domain-containing protein [bacterium]